MKRYYFLWIILIALMGLCLTFYVMWKNVNPPTPPTQEKLNPPSLSPFSSYISGGGVIEASSDNISITTPVNRMVEKVFVPVGAEVKKGSILLQLEDLDLQADLASRQVDYLIALTKLKKLESLPRPEEVMSAEAVFKNAQIDLDQAKNQYESVQKLQDSRALSGQEINRRRFNYEQAQAKEKQAQAQLNLVRAGTWKPDLEVAALEVKQAEAAIARVNADIQRTVIRSPINGKVLQVKIHEGESPAAVAGQGPLMIIGNTSEMYLKVSINQFNAPYFKSSSPAVAFLRGNARIEFPLEFVRLEPYLINKNNLTNEITEKVDTRVLQVIYHIKEKEQNIFVGQQMDVFIEAEFPS